MAALRLPLAVALSDYLEASAARHPDKVALVSGEKRVSYDALASRARALSNALLARGLRRGDRVVVFGDNTEETVIAFFAILEAGAVAVIVSPLTRPERLAYLLEDTRAHTLITTEALSPIFLDVAPRSPHLRAVVVSGALPVGELERLPGGVGFREAEAEGDPCRPPPRRALELDLAAIIYTSGSTGNPKGVMHTHGSLRAAASSIATYLELTPDDVLLGALPLAFGYGLFQVIVGVAIGGTVVLERGFTFPAHVLSRIAKERVTCVAGVPSAFALFGALQPSAEPHGSSVRIVTNAAAALTVRHVEIIRRFFPEARLFSMYGQTECIRGTYLPPDALESRPTSIGIPIPNSEAWLVDEHDRPVGPGRIGQLVIRGPHLMRGYWERPTETAAKLRPGPLPGEVVLYTGDLARVDDDGYFHFVSRMDDIIKSRGEKVSPKEVECAIAELPGVREVAVIGVADEVLGQAIKAFVVVEDGAVVSARDVQRHCQTRLENYMVPKHVVFVPDLPKTSTGKITKVGLA